MPVDLDTIIVNAVADRFQKAGIPGTAPLISLSDLITEKFDVPLLHTQYACDEEMRLRKVEHDAIAITFPVAVLDLDHKLKVKGKKLPHDHFHKLLRTVNALTPSARPHVVAETNGGAHLYFVLNVPVADRIDFEAGHTALRACTSMWVEALGYIVDEAASDWTRITSAPFIKKDDGTDTHDRLIEVFLHDPRSTHEFVDCRPARDAKKAIQRAHRRRQGHVLRPGVMAFDPDKCDITFLLDPPGEGGRYIGLRDSAFYAFGRYHQRDHAAIADALRDTADAIGLSDREIDTALAILEAKQ